jgi:hypothetical protein
MSTTDTQNPGAELSKTADWDVRTVHEWKTGRLSVTVVTAVAEALDADPMGIDPLFASVDPDALDALFAAGEGDASLEFSFQHDGCTVSIRGDGEVRVTVLDA